MSLIEVKLDWGYEYINLHFVLSLAKYSDLNSIRANQSYSEMFRTNLKTFWIFARCKSVRNQFISIRSLLFNTRHLTEWIRSNFPIRTQIDPNQIFKLNYSDLRFIRIENLIRIHSDWSGMIGLIFNRSASNAIHFCSIRFIHIENLIRMHSDLTGMNRIEQDWAGLIRLDRVPIRNFRQACLWTFIFNEISLFWTSEVISIIKWERK